MDFKMIVTALLGCILGTACTDKCEGVFPADAGSYDAGEGEQSDASTSVPAPAADVCLDCCDIFQDPNMLGVVAECNGQTDIGANYLLDHIFEAMCSAGGDCKDVCDPQSSDHCGSEPYMFNAGHECVACMYGQWPAPGVGWALDSCAGITK